MSNVSISFEEMKNDLLKDNEFKNEYEKLKPRYEAIEQIIRARKEQNITQAELAKMVGTQKVIYQGWKVGIIIRLLIF